MNIIGRVEAKAQGLKRYFTGKECKRGHIAERYVSNCACADCEIEKLRAAYHSDPEKHRERRRQYRMDNPEKEAESLRKYREANREKRSASWQRYYADNRESLAEKDKTYREENREAILERQRNWRRKNVARRTSLEAKRRSKLRNAVPAWFSEFDAFVWQEASELARIRRDETGIEWAADHMIPLQATQACGLHVAENCQVIPAYLNNGKKNRMVLTERLEWLK